VVDAKKTVYAEAGVRKWFEFGDFKFWQVPERGFTGATGHLPQFQIHNRPSIKSLPPPFYFLLALPV
jgi:hypothetical protein